jgi:hypothetical protein
MASVQAGNDKEVGEHLAATTEVEDRERSDTAAWESAANETKTGEQASVSGR